MKPTDHEVIGPKDEIVLMVQNLAITSSAC